MKYLYIIFFFNCFFHANSQCWELSFQARDSVLLEGIQFLNDSVGFVYGRENGTAPFLFKTNNGGDSWEELFLPNISNLYGITGLFFLTEEVGWVGSFNSPVLKTQDGGNSWDVITYADSIYFQWIYSMFFENEDVGWFATNNSTIIKTIDGGENVELQVFPTSQMPNSIIFEDMYFHDLERGWIVGGFSLNSEGIVFKTVDGGHQWEEVDIPWLARAHKIEFANDSTGWILAQNNQVFKTIDGGETWTPYLIRNDGTCCSDPYQIFCCVNHFLYGMDFVNDTLGWAAASIDYGVFVTKDGGESWKMINFDGLDTLATSYFAMMNDSLGFLCSGGYAYKPGNPYNRVYRYRGRHATCGPLPTTIQNTTLYPLFSWPVAEGCYDGYYLQLGTTPGGDELLSQIDVGLDTFYQVVEALPDATQVYATVLPYNHVNGAATACESSSFTTITCPPSPIEIDTGYCKGEYLLWGDSLISEPGQYTFPGIRENGCDSTVVVHVIQYEDVITPIDTAYCQGDTFYWQDSLLAEAGMYEFTYIAANGCDSSVIITLYELLPAYNQTDTLLCAGQPYEGQDTLINQAGLYTFTYTAASGCDSLLQVSIEYSPTYNYQVDTFFCEGAAFYWDGQLLESEGVYEFVYQTVQGCDSTWQLILEERMDVYTEIDTALLAGESYNGIYYTNDTLLTFSYPAANGCDSLVQVQLDVISSTSLPQPHIATVPYILYPNPTSGILYIQSNFPVRQLVIWNALGQTISAPYHTGQLDMSSLSAGLYFLRLNVGEYWYSERVVVE